ncbi:MAG: (4Fe-4S)-binding protein [Bacteroidetes bacterium]|nr:(4Fe-4S)-binding protein [Bacteroidota bacterium]
MKSFGYTISKGRVIDYDANDHRLENLVLAAEPTLALCIACGCCAATCTAAQHTGFSLRRINVSLRRGETDIIRQEISGCMLCGKCTILCPRGVSTRNIVFTVRKHLSLLDNNAV